MSKKAREQAKLKRLSMKRKRKAAAKAQYVAWTASGENGKSKRSKLKTKRLRLVKDHKHAVANCGNIGCSRCHPEINHPAYASPGSSLYRKRFMKPWKDEMVHNKLFGKDFLADNPGANQAAA